MSKIQAGIAIAVELLDKDHQPPYRFNGNFYSEDDEAVTILSTFGDTAGRYVVIPKNNIKYIVLTGTTE